MINEDFPFLLSPGQRCGCFSDIQYLCTFLHKHGLHTGETLYDWLGDKIAVKLEDPDATFHQVNTKLLYIRR